VRLLDSSFDIAVLKTSVCWPTYRHAAELRFFAGLNIDETAEALDVSTATVERDWRRTGGNQTRSFRRPTAISTGPQSR
jgi:hypothetical protein